jgi:hypothetical protein
VLNPLTVPKSLFLILCGLVEYPMIAPISLKGANSILLTIVLATLIECIFFPETASTLATAPEPPDPSLSNTTLSSTA